MIVAPCLPWPKPPTLRRMRPAFSPARQKSCGGGTIRRGSGFGRVDQPGGQGVAEQDAKGLISQLITSAMTSPFGRRPTSPGEPKSMAIIIG